MKKRSSDIGISGWFERQKPGKRMLIEFIACAAVVWAVGFLFTTGQLVAH